MYFLKFMYCSFRNPPKPQPQHHRLNLSGPSGGGGPPRRKKSSYTRPQFAGPMELETLMEEGASPVPGSRDGDVSSASDVTRTPFSNGDKAHQQQLGQSRQQQLTAETMKSNSQRSGSTLNLYLAACTGQYLYKYMYTHACNV